MLSPKWQEVVSKWLPFWNRLTTDHKWLYLKMFEAGEFSLQALSREAHIEFDWIQRANLNFIEKNFSAEDIAFLDSFSEQDHKDLILECFVRTMPPGNPSHNCCWCMPSFPPASLVAESFNCGLANLPLEMNRRLVFMGIVCSRIRRYPRHRIFLRDLVRRGRSCSEVCRWARCISSLLQTGCRRTCGVGIPTNAQRPRER